MPQDKGGRRLAYVYAEALYDAALETGVLPEVEEELFAFQQALRRDARLGLFLDSPVIPFADKCFGLRALSMLTQPGYNFLRVLVQRQRVELLDEILEAFHAHCNRKAGIAELDLESACDLDPRQRERLQQVLEAALGRKVVLRGQVRPGLLGGFVLRQEGRVYNTSLAHHLARLMEQIGAARSGLGLYSDQ